MFSVVLTTGRTDCWSKQGKFTLLLMRGFERQDFLLSLDRHWLDERSLDLTQWKCVKMKYISIKPSSTGNKRRSVIWQTIQISAFKELPFWKMATVGRFLTKSTAVIDMIHWGPWEAELSWWRKHLPGVLPPSLALPTYPNPCPNPCTAAMYPPPNYVNYVIFYPSTPVLTEH